MKLFNSAHIDVFAGLVRRGAGLRVVRLTVRYGLIDLKERGLCLVDTGMGAEVTQGTRSPALRLYSSVLRPDLQADAAPEAMLRNMGAATDDVCLVVLTHFHADHVSSLRAFPRAGIIACGDATRRVLAMGSAACLHHGIFRELIPPDLERRLQPLGGLRQLPTGTVLGKGYDLFGNGNYLAVPLPGHAFGHFGIFWRDETGPAVYATDAAWTTEALLDDATPWISSAIVFDDRRAGRATQSLLREFKGEGGRILLCHDIEETAP
jgi:glyoxylase-like metal-dependent hydrolase (beta-lactamase superfamily II)